MKRTLLLAIVALTGLLSAAARAQTLSTATRAAYVPGEVIVKFKPGMSAAQRSGALSDSGASARRSGLPSGTVLARVAPGEVVGAAVQRFERDPRVQWAEPNSYVYGAALPNDPFLGEQWALRNTGQSVDGISGTAGADIHAAQAWDRTTGSPDVKVAVVDSGINFDQPDLAANIWHNPAESSSGRESNGTDDDGNGFIDDWRGWDFVQNDNNPSDNNGHGTHVAGILAARGDNGLGISGVAWRASIIPVRVLANDNTGNCADLAAGEAYAVRTGARVVNVSIGGSFDCQAERDVIDSAPNTLFVVAAMNDGANVDASPVYPCVYPEPNIVCVGATDEFDGLASFSNYGAKSVDLGAPGSAILSTYVNFGTKQTVLTDGFETPLTGRWVTGGSPNTWDRSPFVWVHTGGYALSNSLLGASTGSTDNWAALGVDLTGRRNCWADVWVKGSLGTFDPSQPFAAQDRLLAETSRDGVNWHAVAYDIGTDTAYLHWFFPLSQADESATGGLRFHLITNDGGRGVALDDLEVYCVPPATTYTGARSEFTWLQGTSMATPEVAGVAVLMLSVNPQLSAIDLKQRILASVDPVQGLSGRTVTGGRLDAAKAVDSVPAPPPPSSTSTPPPPPASPSGGGHPGQTGLPPSLLSTAMTIDLSWLGEQVAKRGLRGALRAGGFHDPRLHGFEPGRFTLTVTTAAGRRGIAQGSCSVTAPATCALTARLTRAGRSVLRSSRRVRLTFALAFAPRSGRILVRRLTVSVPR